MTRQANPTHVANKEALKKGKTGMSSCSRLGSLVHRLSIGGVVHPGCTKERGGQELWGKQP